jgi:tetratricopeptide (TPR) repeat protein
MRPARMLLGIVLPLALAWPVNGETVPFPATVQTEGAEVRCKPGTEPAVYITQKLPRGTVVTVVERLPNGWLKIDPPLPGSYSWVNTRFLHQTDRVTGVWIVSAADGQVPSLVGSWARTERPNVIGTLLARGTQLIAIGGTLHQEDGDWLPILSPAGEYRYLLEKDIAGSSGGLIQPLPTTAAHSGPPTLTPTPGDAGLPLLSPVASESPRPQSPEVHVGGPQPGVDPLFQQAEQLERSGNPAGAARLYDELGKKYLTSNHELAIQYYNRAAWLRGGTTPAGRPPATEADAVYLQAQQAEKAGNWPEAIRNYTRLGDLFSDSDYKQSLQYYNRANWLKQRHPAPAATGSLPPVTTGAPPTQAANAQPRAIDVKKAGPGLLRVAPTIDGRQTYVLESAQGGVIAYLTPEPGAEADLARRVGQNVEVLGQIVPGPDVRGQYLTVVRVVPFAGP